VNTDTTTTQHTPGPWKSSDRWGNFGDHDRHEADAPVGQTSRFSYSVADPDNFIVAHCTNPLVTMSSERSEANARLIAAAPELLAACLELVEHIETLPDDTEKCRILRLALNNRAGEKVREAINKATGN
jgi:hypothetical protein